MLDYQTRYVGLVREDLLSSRYNSIYSLVKSTLLKDPTFIAVLADATIVSYSSVTQQPLFIFSLMMDSLVVVGNTKKFIDNKKRKPQSGSVLF